MLWNDMQPALLSLSWPEACKFARQNSPLFSAFLPDIEDTESMISFFYCLLPAFNLVPSCLSSGPVSVLSHQIADSGQ